MTTKTSIQIIGDANDNPDLTKPLLKQGRKWLKRKVTMDELEQQIVSKKENLSSDVGRKNARHCRTQTLSSKSYP